MKKLLEIKKHSYGFYLCPHCGNVMHTPMWVGRLGSESIKGFSKVYELDKSIFDFHPLEQNLYITQCECCHEFCEVKYVKNK